jgi:C4-dicarboxylate-specific signal transduction histidine kinase
LTTLGIFADRAAIRLQVSRVAEAQKKEADAERIAVVSSVAALFAHRLSNVAGTVPLILDTIEDRLRSLDVRDDRISRKLTDLREDTDRLLAMSKHLKLDSVGQLGPINTYDLVKTAVKKAHIDSIKSNETACDVSNQVKDDIGNVIGVDVLLEDILVNLLHNAAEAGARTIVIDAERQDDSQMIDIIVRDDGHGIGEADAPGIFTPFYSTKKANKLDGVGLWVSRIQVHKMGGRLTLVSLRDPTEFRLSLKALSDREESSDQAARA